MTARFQLALVLLLQSSAVAFVPSFTKSASIHSALVSTSRRSSTPDNDSTESEEPIDPFKYYNNNNDADATNADSTPQFSAADARVMKKKNKRKGGGFQQVKDNRDNLPFVVRVTTPDPYTNPELKKERARKNTVADRKKNKRNAANANLKYTNLKIGGIAANIFEQDSESGELLPVLGEFKLDKSTTSGDIIIVGEQTYQVQKARCQYKYAGGQQFEMVRKILEVKPITRVVEEAVLTRSLLKSDELLPSMEEQPPMLE